MSTSLFRPGSSFRQVTESPALMLISKGENPPFPRTATGLVMPTMTAPVKEGGGSALFRKVLGVVLEVVELDPNQGRVLLVVELVLEV